MADGVEQGDAEAFPPAKIRTLRRIILGISLFLAASVLLIWWQRAPIVEHFVQQQLAQRNVRASYKIAQVALRTQRIENLVLGDPARPDMTARSVEVDVDYDGWIPHVGAIRARGVRLFARADADGLHMGELDKFRNPASTEPFTLPDIDLTLDDARARIETPFGSVGVALAGKGPLRDGFTGAAGALMRNVTVPMGEGAADSGRMMCAAPVMSAYFGFAIKAGAPELSGPVRADAIRCAGEGGRDGQEIGAAKLAFQVDAKSDAAFAAFSGTVKGGAQAARGGGATLAAPVIEANFAGDLQAMKGTATLGWAGGRYDAARAGPAQIKGAWRWASAAPSTAPADKNKGGGSGVDATFDVRRLRAFDDAGLTRLAKSAEGTPVGPLAEKLARGLAGVQRDNHMRGKFSISGQGEGGRVTVAALSLTGARGENLALSRGSRFLYDWPAGRWQLDGGLSGRGGDLPELAVRLKPSPAGGVSGQAFVQPYEAKGARLALEPVRFSARPDGSTTVSTRMMLDGPLPQGQVRGLDLPLTARVDGRGNWALNPGCTPVAFKSLAVSSLTLEPRKLSLCGLNGGALAASSGGRMTGGAVVRKVDLAGAIGSSAMRFTASEAKLSLADMGFSLSDADIRMGDMAAPVRLAATMVSGKAAGGGFGGNMNGVQGKIATVPLLIEEGRAGWTFANGALALNGRILVLDDATPDRFNPVESRDFTLRMADGKIRAGGTLNLPGNERRLASVTVVHDLGNSRGQADFRIDGLKFDTQLQPDEVSRIALGVIANVQAVVNGSGAIAWRGDAVTSHGQFSTQGANLAAAFGPVEGLSGTLEMTDLLGLVSKPHQEVRLAMVHPGVEVHDGVIHYQLLPDYRVAIEDGSWPLAGGDLTLLPTVMEMDATRERHLAFRVIGLEAGAFIDLLQLENVSATGTFDGLLPMIFDASGGRIVGGVLAARQEGRGPLIVKSVEGLQIPCDANRQAGRLSYVGQVSNENLGMTGKMAFDALKDLQYKCLTIFMDGAIDGELVTQVVFNGVNRGEFSSIPKIVGKKFVGLPFLFNVKIQAPFRGLMSTAQSFADPSQLIREQMGTDAKEGEGTQNAIAVQPKDSEDVQNRTKK